MRGERSKTRFEYAWFTQEGGQPRQTPRRGIERRLKLCPLFGIEAEALTVRQGFFGAGESAFENKLADGLTQGRGRDLQNTLVGRRYSKIKLFITGLDCRCHCRHVAILFCQLG